MKQFPAFPRVPVLGLAFGGFLPLVCSFPASAQVVLPPTIVTATRFAEPAEPLPLGVSVVTAAEIARSGATTVNEALMRVLGLPGRQDFFGGGEYAIDLRGFGSTADVNQVVVVDGVRLSEADLGGTRLSGIPIESVERIEVLRGSGAVLYGEGATGGVIVITTKAGTGKGRPNGGSVYAAAGSYGLRDLRANANVGAGDVSLDASAEKRDADNHRNNFRSRQDAESLTAQWASGGMRLGARHAEDTLRTGLPGALDAAQYAADPRQTTTPDDQARIRNSRSSVFGSATFGDWEVAGEAGTRDKHLRSLNSGFAYDYDITADDASLRARHSGAFGAARNAFVVGLDHSRWTRDVLGAFGSTAKQSTRAAYVKDDITLAGGTRFSAGWRTEHLQKDESNSGAQVSGTQHAWDLGASHPVLPGLTAYARYGRSFRLANVDEFSFTSPGSLLRPQTSRDAEAGLRWTHATGKVDARLYRSNLEHEIGFDPAAAGAFGIAGANVNFDATRREGLEIDATHAVTASLGLRANVNLRRATFRAGPYAGRDVPLVPRQSVALRADWTPAPSHHLGGGVQWVSSQRPDFGNACAIPAYTTADARYAYEWRQAELSLGVSNLFDRKYYTQAFGCAGGVTTSIYPEPGRAVTAALRVKF